MKNLELLKLSLDHCKINLLNKVLSAAAPIRDFSILYFKKQRSWIAVFFEVRLVCTSINKTVGKFLDSR